MLDLEINAVSRIRRRVTAGLIVAGLILLSILFIFPFFWMIVSSFKDAANVFNLSVFFPERWRWENYAEAFTFQPFLRQIWNSIYITALVVIGTLAICALSGYAFARIKFPGRNLIFILVLSGLMIPVEVMIIPNFFIMKALNLFDTHIPLILLPIVGARSAIATFMMRQFFITLPKEIEEAAVIDGLSRIGVFFRIVMPISTAIMGSVAILVAFHTWNNFIEPLVYINSMELFTIPLALNNFTDGYGLPMWNIQMAATSISVVPILCIYLIAQKRITNAMVFAGMKS